MYKETFYKHENDMQLLDIINTLDRLLNNHYLPLDNLKYWGTYWDIFLLCMVWSYCENEVKGTISWQENVSGPLSYSAETKDNALNGIVKEETCESEDCLEVRKSLGRSLLVSTSGLLISFTESSCVTLPWGQQLHIF